MPGNYAPPHPDVHWGESEFPLAAIEPAAASFNDADGVPAKAYCSGLDSLRGSRAWNGNLADPSVRGMTRLIVKRRGADRQAPPGYSGTGNVVVEMLPGYRYWRATDGGTALTGRISCHPDEAVQLVSLGAASYLS